MYSSIALQKCISNKYNLKKTPPHPIPNKPVKKKKKMKKLFVNGKQSCRADVVGKTKPT